MLSFNQYQYTQALYQLGLEPKHLSSYQALISSELNHINHFLNYLNEQDINLLLNVYNAPEFVLSAGEVSQENLRLICNAFKSIRHRQMQMLMAFYQPSPTLWLKVFKDLFSEYEHYAQLIHHLCIPGKVNHAFLAIAQQKEIQGLPLFHNLLELLIAPLQRLPHYALFAKEIRTSINKSKRTKNNNASAFCREILTFERCIWEYHHVLNDLSHIPMAPILALCQRMHAQDKKFFSERLVALSPNFQALEKQKHP